MELTKEQIQFIDYRLESEGIIYWDIRIEMLDHVISDVEIKLKPENTEYEFKEMVQDSLVDLGWKENFNGGGLDSLNKENFKNYANKRRKIYKKEFYAFFKNNNLVGFLLLFFILYFITSTLIAHKHFVIVSYVLFLMPVLVFFYEGIGLWRKKLGKSLSQIGINEQRKEKYSIFLLNTYFNKIDFAIVPEVVYNDMTELNPAIKENLTILEKSEPIFFYFLGIFNKKTSPKLIEFFKKDMFNEESDDELKEIFNLLSAYNIYKSSTEEIKKLEKFYDEYKELIKK